jgi:hypothetical protein
MFSRSLPTCCGRCEGCRPWRAPDDLSANFKPSRLRTRKVSGITSRLDIERTAERKTVLILRALRSKTFHTHPKRQRGNELKPSLALRLRIPNELKPSLTRRVRIPNELKPSLTRRVSVPSGREQCRPKLGDEEPVKDRSSSRGVAAGSGCGRKNHESGEGIFQIICQGVPLTAMTGEPRKSTKAQLALAVARGITVRKWARHNQVPERTAYRWAKEPEVVAATEKYRRRMIDQAVGQMARRSTWVVKRIAGIAKTGDTDSVRLRALRSIFTDMISVSNYSGMETRMAVLEKEVRAHAAKNGPAVQAK